MYSILVVGAGYIGGAAAHYFKSKNQRVYALTRSAEKAKAFEKEGIHPIVADLSKPETLSEIPPAHFILISAAPDERSESAYQKTYVEGVGNFLKAIRKNPRPFLITYLSSTGVWADQLGDWFSESTEAAPTSERAKILLKAERQILESGYPSIIFRLSGIYGPERNRIALFKKGEWPKPGPDRWMNGIHRDDIVGALPILFNKAEVGQVYLGVDEKPSRQSEIYQWLCEKMGRAPENLFSDETEGKRYRNDKIRKLGFRFEYPSFREGYESFIRLREDPNLSGDERRTDPA